jgi:hypothetical protein
MRCPDTVSGLTAIGIYNRMHLMPDLIAMFYANRRTDITGSYNSFFLGYDASGAATVTSRPGTDHFGHFYKILIPRRPAIICGIHILSISPF